MPMAYGLWHVVLWHYGPMAYGMATATIAAMAVAMAYKASKPLARKQINPAQGKTCRAWKTLARHRRT